MFQHKVLKWRCLRGLWMRSTPWRTNLESAHRHIQIVLYGCWVILDVDVVICTRSSLCTVRVQSSSDFTVLLSHAVPTGFCTPFNHFDSVFLIASTAAAVVYRPPSYCIALENNVLGLAKAFMEITVRASTVRCMMNACILFKDASCYFFDLFCLR